MEQKELTEWKKLHGSNLTIGSEVKIKPSCKYYEPQYDQGTEFKVTLLYVDSGGLNIGIEESASKMWSCDTDGYRIGDLEPV